MGAGEASRDITEICHLTRVMPILTIEEPEIAVPLAQALYAGGIRVIEVTLRTPTALESISQIRTSVPEVCVGAGTILLPKDVKDAHEAGAQFGVSPGTTNALLDAIEDLAMPFLPGVSSASEVMHLMERNFLAQKFFPAEQAGGASFIQALFGPLPQVRFCPTGGIKRDKVSDYLKLDNVMCVGGSWVTPKEALKSRDWDKVTELALTASAL